MRAEPERSEQAVLIGSGLAIFASLLAFAGLLLWLLHSTSDLLDGREGAFLKWAEWTAAVVSVTYLARATLRR
jgi:hypothetical protein